MVVSAVLSPKALAAARKLTQRRRDELRQAADLIRTFKDDHPYVAKIEAAAARVHPEPTIGQRAAGNFRQGHANLHGIEITIEVPRGGVRRGVGADGKEWSKEMSAHYGYIKGTRGADSPRSADSKPEQVDCYIGPDPHSELVFVIDQIKKDGTWDEHKAVLGTHNEADAKALYLKHVPDHCLGAITPMTMEKFKEWAFSRQTRYPVAYKKASAADTSSDRSRSVTKTASVKFCIIKTSAAVPSCASYAPAKAASVAAKSDDEGSTVPFIAVDFDGTVVTYKDWKGEDHFGEVREGAKDGLQQIRDKGWKICIHTCRGDTAKLQKFLDEKELPYDHINENPNQPPGTSDKLYATIYADDKGVDASGPWKEFMPRLIAKVEGQLAKEKKASAADTSSDQLPGSPCAGMLAILSSVYPSASSVKHGTAHPLFAAAMAAGQLPQPPVSVPGPILPCPAPAAFSHTSGVAQASTPAANLLHLVRMQRRINHSTLDQLGAESGGAAAIDEEDDSLDDQHRMVGSHRV